MIRTMLQLASAVLVVAALVALPGCGGSKSPASKTPPAKSGHSEGDGHDHSKDKGDHSGHDHAKEGKPK
jgi:predicted small lipoprotein YifL